MDTARSTDEKKVDAMRKYYEDEYFENNKTLDQLINLDILINVIKEAIEDDPVYEFLSERSKRLTSAKKPKFNLKVDTAKLVEVYGEQFGIGGLNVEDLKTRVFSSIIMSKVMERITHDYEFNNNSLKVFKVSGLSEDEIENIEVIVSTIFSIQSDSKTIGISEINIVKII